MPRILLVQENPALRLLYMVHLHSLSCEVISLPSYSEAFAYLWLDSAFDLLIINGIPPFDNDLAFVVKINHHFPKLRVVVTAQIQHDQMPLAHVLSAQTDAFLFAPMHRADFETLLAKFIVKPANN